MKTRELFTNLKDLGLPVAYYKFDKKTSIPYLIYYADSSADFFSDDTNYASVSNMVLEYYNDTKDFLLEEKINNFFKVNNITYEKTEVHISSEDIYLISYNFEMEE